MTPTTPLRQTAQAPVRTPEASARPASRPDDDVAQRVLDVLATTDDLASWSDHLSTSARTLDERLHLSAQRADVLRGLDLPPGSTVLEIAAGAGAVTRHLGEVSSLVDALEADPDLAAAAARRCEDVSSVRVHHATVDDVPVDAAYDLVVWLTSPEGLSVDDRLARCRPLLRPDGLVVLGVAVDRHEAADERPADESTRAGLTRAASEAGLRGRVLDAYPDHLFTTTLIDHDALLHLAPSLQTAIVRPTGDLPSADDAHRPGAFVLLAGRTLPPTDPAVFWSSNRRADVSACNRVRASDDGACVIVRSRAFPRAPLPAGPISLLPHTEPYVPGDTLTDVLAATPSVDEAGRHLRAWRDLVIEASRRTTSLPWDLIPRNIQVADDGTLHAIDQEWAREDCDASMVLHRGAFWLAHDLVIARVTPWWMTGLTVGTGADLVLALAEVDVPADWRPVMIDREAESMAWVNPMRPHDSLATRIKKEWHNVSDLANQPHDLGAPRSPDDSSEGTVSLQRALVAVSTANGELRERVQQLELARREDDLAHRDHAIGLQAKVETLRTEVERALEAVEAERLTAQAARDELADVRESTTWRLGRAVVTPAASLRGRLRR